ncbi:hypothetical protein D3C71_1703780 [compost metagenome]
MQRHIEPAERIEKPGADNAIHQDEVAAAGIAGRRPGQDVDHGGVLGMGFGFPRRDRTRLDEMPEIV